MANLQEEVIRKTFATTIDVTISKQFKMACVKNNKPMNIVLEELMLLYSNDKITLNK